MRAISERMANAATGTYQDALKGIYKALDRAFDRSAGPDAAAAMAEARGQYRIAKKIAPTPETGLTTASGDISPARLATASRGVPGMQDLGLLGNQMRGLPDSGTAQRLIYQG